MTFYIVLSLFLVLVGMRSACCGGAVHPNLRAPAAGPDAAGMAGGYALNFVLPFPTWAMCSARCSPAAA